MLISDSSITKAGRHDIAEILLKVALSTINKSINQSNIIYKIIQMRFKNQEFRLYVGDS
jgi:hypothetical protein